MIVFDTNILIGYLGGEEAVISALQEWKLERRPFFVSTITECEILAFPKLTPAEERSIEQFLRDNFIAMAFDGSIARRAAAIRRSLPSLKLPDAAIAALALELNTDLVTRNMRDFKKVPGLSVLGI